MTYADQISGRQLQRIHIRLGELHVTDRAEKLRLLSAILYRPVESSKDLNVGEGTVVEATLKGLPDVPAVYRMIAEAEQRMAEAAQ